MYLCLPTVSKATELQKCLFGGNRSFIGFVKKNVVATSRQKGKGLLGNSSGLIKLRKNENKEKPTFL